MKRKLLTVLAFSMFATSAGASPKKNGGSRMKPTVVSESPKSTGKTDAEKGADHLHETFVTAAETLRSRGVMSRAIPDISVADVFPLKTLEAFSVIEHVDLNKVRNDCPAVAIREVLSVIGRKGSQSFAGSASDKGAKGLTQFMSGTYSGLRKTYPEARLGPSFVGKTGELNAAMATILLLDENLTRVKEPRRSELLRSPETLWDFLAASYNAGGGKASMALESGTRIHRRPTLNRWVLSRETRCYLQKFHAWVAVAG